MMTMMSGFIFAVAPTFLTQTDAVPRTVSPAHAVITVPRQLAPVHTRDRGESPVRPRTPRRRRVAQMARDARSRVGRPCGVRNRGAAMSRDERGRDGRHTHRRLGQWLGPRERLKVEAGRSPLTSPKKTPRAPNGARTRGTSRWDPTKISVGASASPTSVNRNSARSPRPRLCTLTHHCPSTS
jgi:hypothetical protein